MNITYDVKKINRIISDFANVTGLSIALLNTEFQYLANYSYNEPEFCLKVQQYKEGKKACIHSDLDMLKKCRETRQFVSHVCHAGIIDSVMPLMKDMVIGGYIVLGRNRPSECFCDVADRLCWMNGEEVQMEECYRKIAYFNESQLRSICNLLEDSLFAAAIKVELNPSLEAVIDYISRDPARDLSVSALCLVGHMSKNMLYKEFKNAFDCTVNEYITRIRIRKACELLIGTGKSIQEIGELVGAESPAHFCRLFKKITGVSPSVYRKMQSSELLHIDSSTESY